MELKRSDMKVLRAIWAVDPESGPAGYPLMKATHLPGPAVYASLDRLEDAGLVEARWEGELWPNGDYPHNEAFVVPGGNRRYYRLTSSGRGMMGPLRHRT